MPDAPFNFIGALTGQLLDRELNPWGLLKKDSIPHQKNPWGVTKELQRSDLWQVWFDEAVKGIKDQKTVSKYGIKAIWPYVVAEPNTLWEPITTIFPAEVQSIQLPENKVRVEPVRRDSRMYNMPSWDEPLDPIRMCFVLDARPKTMSGRSLGVSSLLMILEAWRVLVRAGRGGVSTEINYTLNEKFRIDYAFDVTCQLLGGGTYRPPITVQLPRRDQAASTPSPGTPSVPDETGLTATLSAKTTPTVVRQAGWELENTHIVVLKNVWLCGYKMSELNYTDTKTVTVDATFIAEDILFNPISAKATASIEPFTPSSRPRK